MQIPVKKASLKAWMFIHWMNIHRIFIHRIFIHALNIGLIIIFISCAATPDIVEVRPPETGLAEWPIPSIPEYIMGEGLIEPEYLVYFLLNYNPELEMEFVENLSSIYFEEAVIEGVNHDVAFAQMCLETGFLRFGGLVTPDMNNFCGLGAIGPSQRGEIFPDVRTGVRAHIQHLKAYASTAPLEMDLVDPRYLWVRFGSSPRIQGLAGTWATDREYANKINSILERLYYFSFRGPIARGL